MKIKVRKAEGPLLEWLVAKAEGIAEKLIYNNYIKGWEDTSHYWSKYEPLSNFSHSSKIIDRAGITTICARHNLLWAAAFGQQDPSEVYGEQDDRYDWRRGFYIDEGDCVFGETRAVAALRCFVISKLGEEVEVSDEVWELFK